MDEKRATHVRRAMQNATYAIMICALVESTGGDEIDRTELLRLMSECYAVISHAGSLQSAPVTEPEALASAEQLQIKIRQTVDLGSDFGGDEAANERDLQTAQKSLETAKHELAQALLQS